MIDSDDHRSGAVRALFSIARTIRRSFDFAGRSTRTELVVYYIGAHLLSGLALLPIAFMLNGKERMLLAIFQQAIVMIPVPALVVRRLHDQSQAGVLAGIIATGLIAVGVYASWVKYRAGSFAAHIRPLGDPYTWIVIAIFLVLLVFLFLGGSRGPNRYGPDPRNTENA